MLIRSALSKDLVEVKTLWNAVIRDTTATFTTELKTDAALVDLLNHRVDAFIIAQDTSGIAGFVTWGEFRAGPGYTHTREHTIITTRSGLGIGQRLLEAAMTRATAQNIHSLIAVISSENEAAIAFHTKMGFSQAGHLREVGRKNGRWLDVILMARILDSP